MRFLAVETRLIRWRRLLLYCSVLPFVGTCRKRVGSMRSSGKPWLLKLVLISLVCCFAIELSNLNTFSSRYWWMDLWPWLESLATGCCYRKGIAKAFVEHLFGFVVRIFWFAFTYFPRKWGPLNGLTVLPSMRVSNAFTQTGYCNRSGSPPIALQLRLILIKSGLLNLCLLVKGIGALLARDG